MWDSPSYLPKHEPNIPVQRSILFQTSKKVKLWLWPLTCNPKNMWYLCLCRGSGNKSTCVSLLFNFWAKGFLRDLHSWNGFPTVGLEGAGKIVQLPKMSKTPENNGCLEASAQLHTTISPKQPIPLSVTTAKNIGSYSPHFLRRTYLKPSWFQDNVRAAVSANSPKFIQFIASFVSKTLESQAVQESISKFHAQCASKLNGGRKIQVFSLQTIVLARDLKAFPCNIPGDLND